MARRLTARWPEPSPGATWRDRAQCTYGELRESWGDFLGRVPWQYFVTLTFDPKRHYPVDQQRASRESFWWCRQLGGLYRRPVAWVYVTERGRAGLWHAHVLLTGLGNNTLDVAVQIWKQRNGIADVQRVWDGFRATLYATKSIPEGAEAVVSDTLVLYRGELAPEPKIHFASSFHEERPALGDELDGSMPSAENGTHSMPVVLVEHADATGGRWRLALDLLLEAGGIPAKTD
jgi:hypothetical protein